MKSEKYVEPAKTLSIVLLTLVLVAWKIYEDDTAQLAKLQEARQILAEWFFYDINLTQLRHFEAREAETAKRQDKSIDTFRFPLSRNPFGGSHEIGTVYLVQSPNIVRVFVDPKYDQTHRPKQNTLLKTVGEDERLQSPPEDAVSWSAEIPPGKAKFIRDLFAAQNNVTLSDLVLAFLAMQGSDISEGKSRRELRLSKERYLTSLALDALFLSANIGASPLEKHASAQVLARALNGKAKDTAPTDDEEKLMVGQQFNLLDRHYREAHARVPLIDLDAQPPISLLVLAIMSLLSVGVIRSSTLVMLMSPTSSLDEAWPVFDSPDLTGKILGGAWIMSIAIAPTTIASLGLANAICRQRMSLNVALWWPIFAALSVTGLYYGSSAARVLYRLMRIRWAAIGTVISLAEDQPEGNNGGVAIGKPTVEEASV